MPIYDRVLSAGTAIVRLDGTAITAANGYPTSIAVQNGSANSVWVGGAAVTSATGWLIAANGEFSMDLYQNDALYVVGTAASNVRVIEGGKY